MFIFLGTMILSLIYLPFIGIAAIPVALFICVGTWFIAWSD